MNNRGRRPTFGNIKVEEVTVEDRLDHASNNSNHVKEALEVETPDPVEEIEGPIEALAEQVMGCDRFCLAGLADHEELRQDSNRLQVDGECPQDLETENFNRCPQSVTGFSRERTERPGGKIKCLLRTEYFLL